MEEGKKIIIDFLYLDLYICTRCQGTDEGLDKAIEDVAAVLKLTGIEVVVNKIHIINKEMAIQHKFVSSPYYTSKWKGYTNGSKRISL